MKNNFALTFNQNLSLFSISLQVLLRQSEAALRKQRLDPARAVSIQRTRLSALAERLIIIEWRKNVYVVQRVS